MPDSNYMTVGTMMSHVHIAVLDDAARRRGITRSKLINDLLRRFIGDHSGASGEAVTRSPDDLADKMIRELAESVAKVKGVPLSEALNLVEATPQGRAVRQAGRVAHRDGIPIKKALEDQFAKLGEGRATRA